MNLKPPFDRITIEPGKMGGSPFALIKTEEGYSVSCPGLPGCWSQGKTEEEALANISDAIHDYLIVARELAGERELREVEVSTSSRLMDLGS